MSKTQTQKAYEKAKKKGKVSERKEWLRLGIKKKGGGVKSTGSHKVKLISDKIVMGRAFKTKKERKEIKYTFEEDGEEKFYSVPLFGKDGNLHYLVERLRAYDYNDEFILEMKWVGDRNIIEVRDVESDSDDIPVVEEDEGKKTEEKEKIPVKDQVPENDVDIDEIPF